MRAPSPQRILAQLLSSGQRLNQDLQDLGLERGAQLASALLREQLAPDHLRPWQLETLAAIQQTMCAYENAPGLPSLPDASQTDALEVTLAFMGKMPPHIQRKLSCVIALFEAGPLLLGPTRKRLTKLSPQARAQHLKLWEDAKLDGLKAAFHGLKSACMIGYWSRPQTWPAIGYTLDLQPQAPAFAPTPDQESPDA